MISLIDPGLDRMRVHILTVESLEITTCYRGSIRKAGELD